MNIIKILPQLSNCKFQMILLGFFFLNNSPSSYCQNNNQWLTLSRDEIFWDVTSDSQYVWLATRGGLVRFDPSTNSKSFFNASNAPMLKNEIQSVLIDSGNNLWVGTYSSGLSKFDGISWTNYITFNGFDTITGVSQIEMDKSGNLYFMVGYLGVGNKIYKYNGSNFSDLAPPFPLASNLTNNSIATDTLDNLWCASYGKNLLKYDGSNWIIFDSTNSPIRQNIISIGTDKSNNLWVSNDSIYKFDGFNWTTITSAIAGISLNQFKIKSDEFNNVWFYGNSNTVVKYDGSNFSQISSSTLMGTSGQPGIQIFNLNVDNNGHIWTQSNIEQDSILAEYDGVNLKRHFCSNSGLRSSGVRDIAIDAVGNKWVCNDRRGLQKFDGLTWTSYHRANSSICSNDVVTVSVDNSNNIWVGANNDSTNQLHVSKFDGTIWTSFPLSYFAAPQRVNRIQVDQFNNVWLLIYGQGVAKYDGLSWAFWKASDFGLGTFFASDILVDKNNVVWVTTSGQGLYKYANANWTNYTTFNSTIPSNSLGRLYVDNSNLLWLPINNGLTTFDGNQFSSYNVNSIVGKPISVLQDKFNNYWFGTDNGLTKFDGSVWTNYNIYNSGAGSGIGIIKADKNNTLWLSGGNGLIVFNETGIETSTLYNIPSANFSGKVFFDANSNGIFDTLSEHGMSNQKIECSTDGFMTFSNTLGNYKFYRDSGYYESSYIPFATWGITTDSLIYHSNLNINDIVGLDYGSFSASIDTIADLTFTIGSDRCNSSTSAWLYFQNFGSTNLDGQVMLIKNDSLNFISAVPAPSSVNGDTIIWTYANLRPFESRVINLEMLNPGVNSLNNILTSSAYLFTGFGVADSEIVNQQIRCSYDPNYKSVNPEGIGNQHLVEMGMDLEYTIHFQNLGNDTAYTVIIIDSIPHWMDQNSFVLTGSSHLVFTEISQGGRIKFSFENINLPWAAVNEPGSSGFVKFKLSPLPSMPLNSSVTNIANIFFDINPSISTNTVFNFFTNLPTSIPAVQIQSYFTCYPNPFNESFAIHSINNNNESIDVTIFNLVGEKIFAQIFNTRSMVIDLKDQPPGLYFISIRSSTHSGSFKLIKI